MSKVYVDITMKAAKENEAVTAEQHSRESVRIAQTVRELLKKFTSAYRKFNKAESEHVGVQRSFDALNLNTAACLCRPKYRVFTFAVGLYLFIHCDGKTSGVRTERIKSIINSREG